MSSIIVANSNRDSARKIAMVLKSSGLVVYDICATGAQVVELTTRHYHGGVVVCSMDLPDMPAAGLPQTVNYDFLFIVKAHQAEMATPLDSPCLMVPLNKADLVASVNMLLNISEPSSLSIKKKIAAGTFDPKEIVQKAKVRLMERNYFSESQAHRFLQKKSMDTCKKMVEVAMIVLEMF